MADPGATGRLAIRDLVEPDMPGLTGPGVEAPYTHGARWLAGGPPD